ncbi:MAG: hypothetical protein J0I33_09820 [Microbacterium ginsengisoli]|uniref:hypothetical protein n=2 Tax=Microbacteriaceae TaxID=85023 RepID=UPI0006F87C1C|nr:MULTISPECIES: hypothetical protein [unclassified Microbacterium]KQR92835.1 hypothetical protein ASF93_04950 [Microbacterium sp. Leaf347]MBN9198926.1 hypothetical protein [Microbacterium ginsengisoli]
MVACTLLLACIAPLWALHPLAAAAEAEWMVQVGVGAAALAAGVTWVAIVADGRRRLEGEALRALRASSPSLTTAELAPHLRSIDDFDAWAVRHGVPTDGAQSYGAMEDAWEPSFRTDVLPGRSAQWWKDAVLVAVLGGAVVALASIAVVNLGPQWWAWGWGIGMPIALALFFAGALMRIAAEVRVRREYRAGYATTVMDMCGLSSSPLFADVFTGVDLLDASTGGVVAAAGRRPLSREMFIDRVDTLRRARVVQP